ncbi:hypothetical protein SeLEV6574_g06703, partial [Synchytrium endobioticum]
RTDAAPGPTHDDGTYDDADSSWSSNHGVAIQNANTANWQTSSDPNGSNDKQPGALATSGSISNTQPAGLIIPRTREDLEKAKLKTNQYGDVITEVN